MTRINSAINPNCLTDQHLIAELRELPRIFTLVEKRKLLGIKFNDIPKEFKLGTGHVTFFYNKLLFLQNRHNNLCIEYNNRYSKEWQYTIKGKYTGDYIPTEKERRLLIDRISERLLNSKQQPKYFGNNITPKEAINNLVV